MTVAERLVLYDNNVYVIFYKFTVVRLENYAFNQTCFMI